MATISFDTLKFADTLKQAGVPAAQAEAEARAVAAAIGEIDVATKNDLLALEQRMTIKIGGMFMVAVGILIAVLRVPH
jgi:hypothetical protein